MGIFKQEVRHCSRDLFHAGQPVFRPAGYARLSQIGLQAGYLVVCRVRLLGLLSSQILEQALRGPTHKGSARRSGSLGQGAHTATPRPVAVSAPLEVSLCGLESFAWNPRRRPKDRAAAPRTAPELLQFCCSCDCFGGTKHREVSALTRIPSLKRDKIIIIIIVQHIAHYFSWCGHTARLDRRDLARERQARCFGTKT